MNSKNLQHSQQNKKIIAVKIQLNRWREEYHRINVEESQFNLQNVMATVKQSIYPEGDFVLAYRDEHNDFVIVRSDSDLYLARNLHTLLAVDYQERMKISQLVAPPYTSDVVRLLLCPVEQDESPPKQANNPTVATPSLGPVSPPINPWPSKGLSTSTSKPAQGTPTAPPSSIGTVSGGQPNGSLSGSTSGVPSSGVLNGSTSGGYSLSSRSGESPPSSRSGEQPSGSSSSNITGSSSNRPSGPSTNTSGPPKSPDIASSTPPSRTSGAIDQVINVLMQASGQKREVVQQALTRHNGDVDKALDELMNW